MHNERSQRAALFCSKWAVETISKVVNWLFFFLTPARLIPKKRENNSSFTFHSDLFTRAKNKHFHNSIESNCGGYWAAKWYRWRHHFYANYNRYDHRHLSTSFDGWIFASRELLSAIIAHFYGYTRARISDETLIAFFVADVVAASDYQKTHPMWKKKQRQKLVSYFKLIFRGFHHCLRESIARRWCWFLKTSSELM